MALIETFSAEWIANLKTASSSDLLGGWGIPAAATSALTGAGVRGNRTAISINGDAMVRTAPAVFASSGNVTVGIAVAASAWRSSAYQIMGFKNAASVRAFGVGVSGGFWTLLNSGGSIIATSTVATPANSTIAGPWVYLEVQYQATSAATYNIEVRVNGVAVIPSASYTPTTVNSNTITTLTIGADTGTAWMQDIYILNSSGSSNTTFLGDCRVECLWPSAVGANDTWTLVAGASKTAAVGGPSGGTTANDSDTTCIRVTNAGDRETFTINDLASTAGIVKGVMLASSARGEDNAVQKVSGTVRIGGTDYDSTDYRQVPQASYGLGKACFDVSPATSSTWTATEVNGMEAGPLVIS